MGRLPLVRQAGDEMKSQDKTAAQETLASVQETLFGAAWTIKIRKEDLVKWPDDDEHLHQYRISVRVARSLVKFLKPFMRKGPQQQLEKQLKTLQDPTSRMRELDVLVPLLENEPSLQEQVRQAQLAYRAAFIENLTSSDMQQLLEQVQDSLKHPEWKKNVLANGIAPESLAARLDSRRQSCKKALAELDLDDQEAVHDLRKHAKAIRYVARELTDCLPEGSAGLGERMRLMQDKLGEWCDANVNAELITEVCGPDARDAAAGFRAEADAIMDELKAAHHRR